MGQSAMKIVAVAVLIRMGSARRAAGEAKYANPAGAPPSESSYSSPFENSPNVGAVVLSGEALPLAVEPASMSWATGVRRSPDDITSPKRSEKFSRNHRL
jgi:hypothetical protein